VATTKRSPNTPDLPAVREKLVGGGLEPVGGTPAEFGRFIGSEITKWTKIAPPIAAKKMPAGRT